MLPASECGMAELRPIWPRYPALRARLDEALRPVDLADRVEHRERRLVARALGDLGLGGTDARVALQEPVREVPPAHALADERDLGCGLDRHLRLDPLRDADTVAPESSTERGTAMAEDPRVAVLVGADRPCDAEVGERLRENRLRPRVARVLEVVLHAVERRLGLGVLDLEPRNDEGARAVRGEDEGDRPLGRDEREARVVEDVVRIEEHDPRDALALGRASSASHRARCSSGVIASEVSMAPGA